MSNTDTETSAQAAAEQDRDPLSESSQPLVGAGACLRAQRESLSWSIEQVASQLNLAPRQIQALEDDDYAALPGMAIVRGFVRSYAKLLKIDPAPLMASMPSTIEHHAESLQGRRELTMPFSDAARLSSLGHRSRFSRTMLAAILGIVLVIGFFGVRQFNWIDVTDFSWLQQGQPIQANVESSASDVSDSSISVVAAENEDGATNSEMFVPELQAMAPPEGALATTQAATSQSDLTSVTEKNGLVIKLREDSWIEVRRVAERNESSKIVHARLMKAGTTELIDVSGPIALTIGNASGVDATWRGEPLDLQSGMKNNVARLNLK